MASLHLPPAFPATVKRNSSTAAFPSERRHLIYASSATPSPPETEKPEIELEFIGPKPENNGRYPVEKAKALSGEKLLRNIMTDNKIELYATYGKVMNCGGGGSCGTCIVEILDGKDLLNERTNTELKYLKKASKLAPVQASTRIYIDIICMKGQLLSSNTLQILDVYPDR